MRLSARVVVHEITGALSPAQALDLIDVHPYDVVLCDVLMPEMTGMELYAQLVSSRPDLARRVVFMTGGSLGPAVHQFFEGIENERIDKPFDADELWPLLERARRR